jgi:predicted ATPase
MAMLDRIMLDRIEVQPGPGYRPNAWYFDIPAIAQLRDHGLDLTPATVIVGENGSGKSTLMEALAQAWRGHALTGAQVTHWAPSAGTEDADLGRHLRLRGERPAPQGGCFLRAEAMHGLFTAVDDAGFDRQAFGGALNTRSHGESFLAFLDSRTSERGLFLLDEPEAALSFNSCLRLLSLLELLVAAGNQVVLATHSPVLAALPVARILQFDEHGISESEWAELELVQHWQAFLTGPQRYLRYLVDDRLADDRRQADV